VEALIGNLFIFDLFLESKLFLFQQERERERERGRERERERERERKREREILLNQVILD